MKNISRNGIQAAIVYKDSYLCHSTYPSFSLDGSSAFTIEIRFAYSKSNEGILYSQDNGITIGFNDDIPFFIHPTLGRLDGTDDRKLNKNCLLMVSVSYDLTKIRMHINGIVVCERDKQELEPYQTTGNFNIGKDFNGFIEGVRVLKKVPTDQELIYDYGMGFKDDDDTVFRTDFSTKQFKDIGPDKIAMWRTGTEARCVYVVSATRLDASAAYMRTNKLSFSDGISVSSRIYPDFSVKKKQTIYSLGTTDSILSISMEPDENNSFYLTATVFGKTIKTSKEIEGLLWHDIVLSLDIKGNKTALFLDGEKLIEDDVESSEIKDTTSVIGSEFFTDKPLYKEGYAGFIDYVSEFSKAVSLEEVERFIEHEPYFYDDGIASLLLFGWGEPKNAMLGSNIAEYGSGYYTMIEDTCPLDTSRGAGWIVPQDPDEDYWNKLTPNEQWALETYIKTVNETLSYMTGIPMGDNSEVPESEIIHREYRGPDIDLVLAWAGGLDDSRVSGVLEEDIPISDRVQSIHEISNPEGRRSLQQQFAVIETFAYAATALLMIGGDSTTIACSDTIFKSKVGILAVGALVANIALLVIFQEEIRPYCVSELVIDNISYNNLGNAEKGTIYFHNDIEFRAPDSMQWKRNVMGIDIQAVFISTLLKELILRVEVCNLGCKPYTGHLKLSGNGKTWKTESFTLGIGECKVVSFDQSDLIESFTGIFGTINGLYSIYYSNPDTGYYSFFCNIKYKFYLLVDKPISPWKLDEGKEYDKKSNYYINTLLLDSFFAVKNEDDNITVPNPSTAERNTAEAVIHMLNISDTFTYNTDEGASRYTYGDNLFKISKFLRDKYDGNNRHPLNCTDCANIMLFCCALFHVPLPMVKLRGFNNDPDPYDPDDPNPEGFFVNQVNLIPYLIEDQHGNPIVQWEYPFEGTASEGFFSYHQLNRTANGIFDGVGVYDACLQVDGGGFPWEDVRDPGVHAKNPLTPIALQAQETVYGIVNIDRTTLPAAGYTALVYRERIAQTDQNVFFEDLGTNQDFAVGDYSDELSNMQKTEGKLKSDARISEIKPLSWDCNEYEWRFSFDGCIMEIMEYQWAKSDEDMKRIIHLSSNHKKEKIKDDTADIEGVKIGKRCYIIRKNDTIYRIIGEKAMIVATEVL